MRIIELKDLPGALRALERVGPELAAESERVAASRQLALCVDDGLDEADRELLRREAGRLGMLVLGSERVVLVADDRGFARLASALESSGQTQLGAAIRETLANCHRSHFVVRFADGAAIELGSHTRVMGVLNVTPDSFSDGGRFGRAEEAVDAAAQMVDEGAELVDVGGESTRPGARPVGENEEIARVLPVVDGIKRRLRVRVSVDTRNAEVARRAIEAGADLINDVSAFSDPGMLPLLRDTRVPVVVMHMRGTPATMQADTRYDDLMGSIVSFLRDATQKGTAAGVDDDRILVDPGIGFGKSPSGNLEILRQLPVLRSVGRPILVGVSRKSFIGVVLDLPVTERLEGSLAAAALAAWQGAHVIRAHDVAATCRAVRMIDAVRAAPS